MTKFAAIDIGANEVRLVVKSLEIDSIDSSRNLSQDILMRFPLNLGEDAFRDKSISKAKVKQLLHLMRICRQLTKLLEITEIRACATSAMRDVKNGPLIAKKISSKTGINIEIIGSDEETRMIYDAHLRKLLNRGRDYLYIDVGGGSTQLSLISEDKLVYSHSFKVGTVRMKNNTVDPNEKALFRKKLIEFNKYYPDLCLIGSGGNIDKLHRLKLNPANKNKMSMRTLQIINKELSKLTTEERMKKYKIKRDRAEGIGFATDIFLEAAKINYATEIIIPSIAVNITDGIINKMFLNYLKLERKRAISV
ncbi:MAG: Ppx/GppA family phosphatase [Prevotellaceae bacterium]|jgi:exopolyphosphatase/guanosine-5'-triphosphate,3'-diphosphate pyrophosphatase|nr:Ppx/GppA family phosphatase [Prevotellaceae bacterium]